MAEYTRAIRAHSDYPEAFMARGLARELKGEFDSAMLDYASASRLRPEWSGPYNTRALLHLQMNNNEAALQDLDRALDLAREAKELLPDSPVVADTLGWVLYKKGLASAAVSYLREAEGGLAPGDPLRGVVRHHLALALAADGKPDEARTTIEAALKDLATSSTDGRPEGAAPVSEPPWARSMREMLARLERDS